MLKKIDIYNFIIGFFLLAWGLLIFYPFYNAVLVSFMTEAEYMRNPFSLFVKNPTFTSYIEIFSDDKILNGYRSTLSVILFHLPLNLISTSTMAYALSRKPFPFSKFVNNAVVFTMYFGGGIIPLYLLIRSYGLMGSLWSVILVGIVSPYNMILMKNFFHSIPGSMEESAKIDGANDIVIFSRIYIPMALPIVATILLFVTVSKWNEWYNPMLFISDSKKWPLQLVLREIIGNVNSRLQEENLESEEMMRETFLLNVQMAAVVVTMLPSMLIYPFLQKYFMKGIMVGAVKS